jgi:hypothetical protein
MAIENNLLRKGKHILVERDPLIARSIRKQIVGSDLKFDLQQKQLKNVVLDTELEYAHLDFLGALNIEEATWISKMKIAKGASIFFTFNYEHRRNAIIPYRTWRKLITNNPNLNSIYLEEYYDQWRHDPVIATYQTVLRCLLRKYEFKCNRPILYRDKQKMAVYRFYNFRPTTKPQLPNILPLYQENKTTNPQPEIINMTIPNSHSKTQELVTAFSRTKNNPDLLRGWKRSCTVYCQKQAKATGRPAYRFLNAVKAKLTQAGHDTSRLTGYKVM